MAWDLTVATVSKKAYINQSSGVRISRRFNERGTLTFRTVPGYVPAMHAAVVAYAQDGTTKLFTGVIVGRKSVGGPYEPYFTDIECVDASIYADWVSTVSTFATTEIKTLKYLLQQLVPYITAYGVTLDAAQVTGPDVDPVAWPTMKISDCLRELTERTGYVWRINEDLELSMSDPGNTPAAFAIEDADTNCLSIDWEEDDENYGTKVILTCGGTGTETKTASFVGADHTHDGDLRYFDVRYNVSGDNGLMWPNVITVTGQPAVSGPVSWGYSALWMWSWDYLEHRLVFNTAIGGEFDHGWAIESFSFTAQFPFTITDDSLDTPVVEYRASAETITDYDAGVAAAATTLAAVHRRAKRFTITTLDHGLNPGDTIPIDLTARDVDCDALAESVDIDLITDGFWRYTVSALEGAAWQGSELDVFRQMLGTSSSGSVSVGGIGITITTLGSPAFLGGSRSTSLAPSPAAYTPVVNWVAFVAPGTLSAVLRVWAWARNAAVTVTVKLTSGTDGTTYATTDVTLTAVTAVVPTERTANVALTVGRYYRLEILSSAASEGGFCIGQLEPV